MYEGKTALHVAIEEGSPTAVKLLLEYKANLELQVCLVCLLFLISPELYLKYVHLTYMYLCCDKGLLIRIVQMLGKSSKGK